MSAWEVFMLIAGIVVVIVLLALPLWVTGLSVRAAWSRRSQRFRDWDDGWVAGSSIVSGRAGAERHQNPYGGRR